MTRKPINGRAKGAALARVDAATCEFFAAIGMTTGEMAAAIGVSAPLIRKRSREYGISFPNKPSLLRRFHKGYCVTQSGCWEWVKTSRGNGYGCIAQDGRLLSAHRISFELYHGSVPEGAFVCHRCDNPKCVNPGHLFAGTPADNTRDMHEKGRCNAPSGPRHHAAKLSSEDVSAVRNASESLSEIASRFGVDPSTVWKIKHGKRRANG